MTIKDIRTAIFGLEQHRRPTDGVRARVLSTVRAASEALGFEPRVTMDGPLDMAIPPDVAEAMLATLREALSNAARHAQATAVDVHVAVEDNVVLIRVSDNGVGLDPRLVAGAGHGLPNMADRAARFGGTFETAPCPPSGTTVTWRVPLT